MLTRPCLRQGLPKQFHPSDTSWPFPDAADPLGRNTIFTNARPDDAANDCSGRICITTAFDGCGRRHCAIRSAHILEVFEEGNLDICWSSVGRELLTSSELVLGTFIGDPWVDVASL